MALIDEIIDIQVTRDTTPLSEAGFGTPLLVTEHEEFEDRVRFYGSLAEVVEDFPESSRPYIAAEGVFAQDRVPSQIAIGKRVPATLVFSADLIADNVFNVSINSSAITPVTYASSHLDTMNAIAAAIEEKDGVASATVGGANNRTITIISDDLAALVIASAAVTLGSSQATVEITQIETITAALNAIRSAFDEFYGVGITSRVEADQLLLSAWTESNDKLCSLASSDEDILDAVKTTDIANVAKGLSRDRTIVVYHQSANTLFPDFSLLSRFLATTPGESIVAFKTISGVLVSPLSTSERNAARGKNCNVYVEIYRGTNGILDGKVASGEYIDTIRNVDFHKTRIQEAILSIMTRLEKIAFTDAGVALAENELRGRVQADIASGILAADPAPTYQIPLVSSVPRNDRAGRVLPSMTYQAVLEGAIQKFILRGTVSV